MRSAERVRHAEVTVHELAKGLVTPGTERRPVRLKRNEQMGEGSEGTGLTKKDEAGRHITDSIFMSMQ